MIFIDTDEQFSWLLEAFESDCFQVESREWTKEEEEELSKEIARRKAMRKEIPSREAVLA